MIIEFTGLPGSGKSYLSSLLADKLCKDNTKVAEPSRSIGHAAALPRLTAKLCCVLIFLITHPLQFLQTVRAVSRTRQNSFSNLIKSILNILFIRGLMVLYGRSRHIVILDQGIIQGCGSVFFGGSVPLEDKFLNSLPLSDMVIRVTVPLKTALSRLALRQSGGGSRVEASPEEGLRRFVSALDSVEKYFSGLVPVVMDAVNDDNGETAVIEGLKKLILEKLNKEEN